MYDVILENEYGDKLSFVDNPIFTITSIEGINPPSATINTSEMAQIPGAKYNNSKTNVRQILIKFSINLNPQENRLKIYKVIKSEKYIKFYTKRGNKDISIEGYVQSVDIGYFSLKQDVSISILCPYPYFNETQEVINNLDVVVPNFHFPFAITKEDPIPISYIDTTSSAVINNKGDIEYGLKIEISARGNVTNPKIFNYITGEFIGIKYNLLPGDLITITTGVGQKEVTLLRENKEINIFNYLLKGITWLSVRGGENIFVCESEEGIRNMSTKITHQNLYEGV